MQTRVKTKSEIAAMREGGRMLRSVLESLRPLTIPGASTKDLAIEAARELKSLGGKPAFLGHEGFPDVICISLNDEVVHGIPDPKRVIQAGDIVSLDFGVLYRGLMTDGAITVIAGKAKDQRHIQLLKDTEESLEAGISVVGDGIRVGDISAAIEARLASKRYGIPRDLVGHGIGAHLWEEPNIPNYGRAHTGPWLKAGMTVAIEPMVTLGSFEIGVADDGWTIATADGALAAHFEHTILITGDGAEILTQL